MRPLIVVAGDILVDVDICATSQRVTDDGVPVIPGFDAWTSQFATKVDFAAFAHETHESLGGAAAVARMAFGLGADVLLLGNSVASNNKRGLWADVFQRPTEDRPNGIWSLALGAYTEASIKRRLMVDGRTMLRIDQDRHCQFTELGTATANRIRAHRKRNPGQPVYLILSDYAKGVLDNPQFVRDLVAAVDPDAVYVDPHSTRETPDKHFGACAVMALPFCENWREMTLSDSVRRVLWKREEKGLFLVDNGGQDRFSLSPGSVGFFPADFPDKVLDTCGCGDMAIAALAVARGEGMSWIDALYFATAAAAEKTLVRGANPIPRAVVDQRIGAAAKLEEVT